ncbi:MAG: ATP-binding cassette domain-containing protein, partial [bacterium]
MTLRADNLVKHFNGVRALSGTSVEFMRSSGITAIIGPNGAGKTTLVDALTGFLRVDSGRSFLGAVETTRLRPDQVARLGVARTFQEERLSWRESVLDNVMVAIPSSGERLYRALIGIGQRGEHESIQAQALDALRVVGLHEHG